jgi:RHS repeat-associated protein
LRRYSQTTAYGGTTTYLHDNKVVTQSTTTNAPPNPINNYLTIPGTGEVVAFSTTNSGTFIPIQDGQGSAIGLVNSSNVLQTEFTYDPFGKVTAGGSASQYPYLFKGMEYDTTGLYYAGGIYYSPALGRPLQQVSPGGGGGGGGGFNAAMPSSQGSGGGLNQYETNAVNLGAGAAAGTGAFFGAGAAAGAAAAADGGLLASLGPAIIALGGPTGVGLIVGAVVAAVLGLLDLFGVFGGSSAPSLIPAQWRIPHSVPSIIIGCEAVAPTMSDIALAEVLGGVTIVGLLSNPYVLGVAALMATAYAGWEVYTHFARRPTVKNRAPFNPGRDASGNCIPCPPNEYYTEEGNKHGATNGWHAHGDIWNQDKETCWCRPDRLSGPDIFHLK